MSRIAAPRLRALSKFALHIGDRTLVKPAHRLVGQNEGRLARQRPGQD